MSYLNKVLAVLEEHKIDLTQLDSQSRKVIEMSLNMFIMEMLKNSDELELLDKHPSKYTGDEIKSIIFDHTIDNINLNKRDVKEIIKSTYKKGLLLSFCL